MLRAWLLSKVTLALMVALLSSKASRLLGSCMLEALYKTLALVVVS